MAPGNPCPYCRSPVEPSQSSKDCPSCGAPHHADCWTENGGCAVVACASGPKAASTPTTVLPPIEEPSPPVVVEVEEEGGKRSRALVFALATVGVVAMVAIGVAVAVLLRNASKGESIEVREASATPSRPVAPQAAQSAAARPTDPGEFSEAEVIAGAAGVLLHHHRLLAKAEGDPNSPYAHRAFALLSARKRQKESEDGAAEGQSGFEYWITKREGENLSIGSEVCLPGTVDLRPPGYWNPRDGEAMVYVDYGSYAGFTWVLYEHGHWTYDAGYGHVPSREARWAPREEILFRSTGLGC
jgi:Prokaryotic RING finger family 1